MDVDLAKMYDTLLADPALLYGLFVGLTLLVIVVLLLKAPTSGSNGSASKKATGTKTVIDEDGREVRRSTR